MWVTGRLETDEWEKDGVTSKSTRVNARTAKVLTKFRAPLDERGNQERPERTGPTKPITESIDAATSRAIDDVLGQEPDDIPF